MAKTAPLKKGCKFCSLLHITSANILLATSVRSREARRATSPGINTDKTLKEIKPPVETKSKRPSVLAVHQGAGVTKKSKNGRKSVLSSKAKRRHEKGLDRAEAVIDKKGTRIEKSRTRSRTVQERAKGWDDQNKKIAAKKAQDVLENKLGSDDEFSDTDDEPVGDAQDDVVLEDAAVSTVEPVLQAKEVGEDEEEIL